MLPDRSRRKASIAVCVRSIFVNATAEESGVQASSGPRRSRSPSKETDRLVVARPEESQVTTLTEGDAFGSPGFG